jgi:hypothetical protein
VAELDTDTTRTDTTDGTSAASSPAPETTPNQTETQPSSGAETDSTAAPSSGDTPLSERDGLLAAVRAVVRTQETPAIPPGDAATHGQDTDTAGTTGADPGTQTTDPKQAQTTEPLADPTDADLKKLRPETRRRFEQLLSQRDEARTQLTALTPELEQHRQLQGYLREHQLNPDDVNMLLGVGAALRRGDFQAFLNGVTPYVRAAEEAIGARLAPDLRQQVDDGLITEEHARELTVRRFQANQARSELDQVRTTHAQEDQGRALETVRLAITNWENDIRSRDPDYALKAVAVRRFSQALLQERGAPRTPQEALRLVQDAYQEATDTFVKARPAPRPTRMVPSGINGTAHGADLGPATMKEAAIMALRNMSRAS